MTTFYVTKLAGPTIAGVVKNPGVGCPVELSEAQAVHPLRIKHISREAEKKTPRPKPAQDPAVE